MLRPDKTKILPEFFLFQLLSPLVQKEQIEPVTKGSASPHLNIGALQQFRLIVPCLGTQERVVQHEADSRKDRRSPFSPTGPPCSRWMHYCHQF
jgi:hypothetical protein